MLKGEAALEYALRWVRFWTPSGLLDLYHRYRAQRLASPDVQQPASTGPVSVEFLLPQRMLSELLPGVDQEYVSVPVGEVFREKDMVLPIVEWLTLAGVCKHTRPLRAFEVGTYTGSSTLAMAMNSPDQAEIFTLDLDPSERDAQFAREGINIPPFTVGACFQHSEYAGKINQLFGDSRTFDFTPFYKSMDLVLVDANHTYDFAKSDTQAALRLLRPGGVLIWDDYLWEERHAECAGVTRFVNELAVSTPCFNIAGTRLAIHIAGGPSGG